VSLGLLPSSHVAFFFSDPAGAKACLAAAFLIEHQHPGARITLSTNRVRDFLAEWPRSVRHVDRPDDDAFRGAEVVFTGTSHPDSSGGFELAALTEARRRGLPSYAFVDHWVNFRKRFLLDGALVLPDRVLVLDERARGLAMADGLPEERLATLANPYLTYLGRHFRPARGRDDLLRALGVVEDKVILYAPDPISLRPEGSPFDELSATRDLLRCLEFFPDGKVRVLARLHPLQPAGPLDALLSVRNVTRVPASVPGPDLALASDGVVGFHSNFLLEARALGRPVIRYYPGDRATDPLGHLDLPPATTPDELLQALARVVDGGGTP
jgi:hypothetical protein